MTNSIHDEAAYITHLAQALKPVLARRPHDLELLLVIAMMRISQDIADGRFVTLPFIGQFKSVDNRGAMIRYVADPALISACQQVLDEQLQTGPSAVCEATIEDWPLAEDHRYMRSAQP